MKNHTNAFGNKAVTTPHTLLRQRGTAVIVALFVVALVAITAVAMIERLRIDTRRTELFLNNNQANLYAQGSVDWAIDTLTSNLAHKQPNAVIDKMPIESPTNTEGGMTIKSIITDAQATLNLNNTTDPDYQAYLMRLIQIVDPTTNTDTAKNIVLGVVDWIKPGANNSPFDQYYAKQTTPYRAPHHLMASVSELRMIKGVTPKLYAMLAPYLTALPAPTPININDAPIPTLMSLSPTMTREAANTIAQYSKTHPFPDTAHVMGFDIIKNHPINEKTITTTSEFFLVKTRITVGEQQLTLYTLLHRVIQGTTPMTTMVWQTKGTL